MSLHAARTINSNTTYCSYCVPSVIRQILLIHTDLDQLEVNQTALEMTTVWTVLSANCTRQGIQMAQMYQPDAIVYDLDALNTSPIDLLNALRQNVQTRLIPVILLVERVRLFDQQYFEQLGVAGIIAKPFDAFQLNELIENFLHSWVH